MQVLISYAGMGVVDWHGAHFGSCLALVEYVWAILWVVFAFGRVRVWGRSSDSFGPRKRMDSRQAGRLDSGKWTFFGQVVCLFADPTFWGRSLPWGRCGLSSRR